MNKKFITPFTTFKVQTDIWNELSVKLVSPINDNERYYLVELDISSDLDDIIFNMYVIRLIWDNDDKKFYNYSLINKENYNSKIIAGINGVLYSLDEMNGYMSPTIMEYVINYEKLDELTKDIERMIVDNLL